MVELKDKNSSYNRIKYESKVQNSIYSLLL